MQRRFLKIKVSVVFTIGFIGFLVHLTFCLSYFYCVIFDPALSLPLAHVYFVVQNK